MKRLDNQKRLIAIFCIFIISLIVIQSFWQTTVAKRPPRPPRPTPTPTSLPTPTPSLTPTPTPTSTPTPPGPIYLFTRTIIQSTDAKLAIVNGQRYILTTTWAQNCPITVYTATSDWNIQSTVSVSTSHVANDFYAYTFSTIPNTIIMVGTNSSYYTPRAGFIASYNVQTNVWNWLIVPSVGWITNIINPHENTFYILPAGNVNYFWKTNADELFNFSSWERIVMPTWTRPDIESRITYYNGFLYVLRSNHATFWDLYKWDEASTWILVAKNYDLARDGIGPMVFPYITSSLNGVVFTAPFANATWDVYYSTTGNSFLKLKNYPMITPFLGGVTREIQSYGYLFEQDKIALLNTQLGNTGGYVEILSIDGTSLGKGSGYTTHYTEATFLKDTGHLIAGGEYADGGIPLGGTPCDLKIVHMGS